MRANFVEPGLRVWLAASFPAVSTAVTFTGAVSGTGGGVTTGVMPGSDAPVNAGFASPAITPCNLTAVAAAGVGIGVVPEFAGPTGPWGPVTPVVPVAPGSPA